jgi:hypothetical protein
MSPKIAGTLLALVGVMGAVGSGWLLANPPWSIAGAIALTLSAIAMAIGLMMRLRPSWQDRLWPPDPPVNLRRLRRRLLVHAIVSAIAAPALICLAVYAAVTEDFTGITVFRLFFAVLVTAQAILNVRTFKRAAAALQERSQASPADN